MAARKTKPNVYRLIIQWTIVFLLAYMVGRWWFDASYQPDFEAYCPFGGLQALSSWGVLNSLACSMTSLQITMGLTLLVATVLFSKLFCGFICPIGIATEWLGRLGDKWKMRLNITGWTDRILRLPKYVLLFITFYFTVGSSELFCKQYDPFYAAFTGFGGDVVPMYAIPALIITILGGIFLRQFWCKYLCPLGAITNIFTYFLVFAGVLVAYFGIRLAGVELSWIWPLAILCVAGYGMEMWKMSSRSFPLFKVTRHDEVCTHCRICTKACPQGIDVMNLDRVDHIDCNLCSQCVIRCPEKGALKINGRQWNWFPALVTVVLVFFGVAFGSRMVQIPTVDERWGSSAEMENAMVYQQAGIKQIKCFGSSRSFVEQMRELPGVLGVATYVADKSVKIWYNPNILSPEKIKEHMFSPVHFLIENPELDEVSYIRFGIDQFFDRYDSGYLEELLLQQEGILGLETSFGEPVNATLFFDPARWNPAGLKALIETAELVLGEGDDQRIIPLKFELAAMKPEQGLLSLKAFHLRMFEPYRNSFNGYDEIDPALIQKAEFPAPGIEDPALAKWLPFLESHLSQDEGIVAWETFLQADQPMIRLLFLPAKTNPASFPARLQADSLLVTYNTGEKEKVINPFRF